VELDCCSCHRGHLEPFPELFEQVFYLEQDYKEPPTFCQAFGKSFENVFDLEPNLE